MIATLNSIMEFDHVIEVMEDGTIRDRNDLYAPDLCGEDADSCELLGSFHGVTGALQRDRWELLNGYSRQDRYAGPIMHNSEYIGGAMERDIRETPGVYVALVCCYWPDDEGPDTEIDFDGWAVARYTGLVPWLPGDSPAVAAT